MKYGVIMLHVTFDMKHATSFIMFDVCKGLVRKLDKCITIQFRLAA